MVHTDEVGGGGQNVSLLLDEGGGREVTLFEGVQHFLHFGVVERNLFSRVAVLLRKEKDGKSKNGSKLHSWVRVRK